MVVEREGDDQGGKEIVCVLSHHQITSAANLGSSSSTGLQLESLTHFDVWLAPPSRLHEMRVRRRHRSSLPGGPRGEPMGCAFEKDEEMEGLG